MKKLFLRFITAFLLPYSLAGQYVSLSPTASQSVQQPAGTSLNVSVLEGVINADLWCLTPGTYDQTCLLRAVTEAGAGTNARIFLAPHAYDFSTPITLSNLSNVTIVGAGPATVIKGSGGAPAITCIFCANVKVQDLEWQTTASPVLVASSQLPSADTLVVLQRIGAGLQTPITGYSIVSNRPCFAASNTYTAGQVVFINGMEQSGFLNFQNFVVQSTGLSASQFCGTNPHFSHADVSSTNESGYAQLGSGVGYQPGANDGDVVPVGYEGGECTVACLSPAQAAEKFDTGFECHNCSKLEVAGMTGKYYTLTFYDSSDVRVHDNFVAGGKGFGCIAFWKAGTGSPDSRFISVQNNTITGCTYGGIILAGVSDFIVTGNNIAFVGESGIKTGQEPTRYANNGTIANNTSTGSWFDGFDISATHGNSPSIVRNLSVTGNHANLNRRVPFYSDGSYIALTGNTAFGNGSGADLYFCNSTISGNDFSGNVTTNGATGYFDPGYLSQLTITVNGGLTCGNNSVTGNHTDARGRSGVYGILADNSYIAPSVFSGNIETSGSGTAGIRISENNWLSNNFAGGIRLLDSTAQINFRHSGTTSLIPEDVAGGFTATIPAHSGTLAETNLAQNWVGQQGFAQNALCSLSAGTYCINATNTPGYFTFTLPAASGTLAEQSSFSGTKVAGACTLTIANGIITNVTGC